MHLYGCVQEAGKRLMLFTAEEDIFALQRTLSRLTEMQTKTYWVQAGRRQMLRRRLTGTALKSDEVSE